MPNKKCTDSTVGKKRQIQCEKGRLLGLETPFIKLSTRIEITDRCLTKIVKRVLHSQVTFVDHESLLIVITVIVV